MSPEFILLILNPDNANRYIAYLGTDDAQNIYARYSFIKASASDLALKPIPEPKPEPAPAPDKK